MAMQLLKSAAVPTPSVFPAELPEAPPSGNGRELRSGVPQQERKRGHAHGEGGAWRGSRSARAEGAAPATVAIGCEAQHQERKRGSAKKG